MTLFHCFFFVCITLIPTCSFCLSIISFKITSSLCSNTTSSINTNAQRPTPPPAQPQKFVIVTQRPSTPQPTTPTTTVLPGGLTGAIKYPNPSTINTINLPQNIQVQKVQQSPKIVIVNPPNSQQQTQSGGSSAGVINKIDLFGALQFY